MKVTFIEEFFSIVYTFAARGVFVSFFMKFKIVFSPTGTEKPTWNMNFMIVLTIADNCLGSDFSISGQGHGHVTSKLVLRKP